MLTPLDRRFQSAQMHGSHFFGTWLKAMVGVTIAHMFMDHSMSFLDARLLDAVLAAAAAYLAYDPLAPDNTGNIFALRGGRVSSVTPIRDFWNDIVFRLRQEKRVMCLRAFVE